MLYFVLIIVLLPALYDASVYTAKKSNVLGSSFNFSTKNFYHNFLGFLQNAGTVVLKILVTALIYILYIHNLHWYQYNDNFDYMHNTIYITKLCKNKREITQQLE